MTKKWIEYWLRKDFKLPTFRKSAANLRLWMFLIFISNSLSAQVFAPLQHDTKALFTTWPEKGRSSYLIVNDTSIVENNVKYNLFQSWLVDGGPWGEGTIPAPDECDSWGSGGLCYPLDIPLWFGSSIIRFQPNVYVFITSSGDSINFNFQLEQGDTNLVYSGIDSSILLIYEATDSATFLNFTDSVSKYRIAHLNQAGEPVNSALHNAPITIGKELGIIHFFRIDSFPAILQPVQLIGHKSTQIGLYQIKPETIFDFNEGDIFQYREEQSNFAPGTAYTQYTTRTVVSRVETEIEIQYSMHEDWVRFQTVVSGTWPWINNSIDTLFGTDETILTIDKNEVWTEIPFNLSTNYDFSRIMFENNGCNLDWQYHRQGSFWNLCTTVDSVPCYANSAHFAPGEGYAIAGPAVYKPGFGILNLLSGYQIVSGVTNSLQQTLIFSNKGGETCGNEWILSVRNYNNSSKRFKIYPNPASTTITLHLPNHTLTHATLIDMQSREVLSVPLSPEEPVVDVRHLSKGMYLVRATDFGGGEYIKKIIVQ